MRPCAIAVLNRQSGTLRTTDLEAYCAHLTGEFDAAGRDLTCEIVDGDDVIEALETAAGNADIVIAAGGDGTISSAAAIAWRSGTPLGIIPAGTMNFFARTVGIPADIRAAATALASAEVHDCDIASANGRAFVHQFAIGLHPRMVRYRRRFDYSSRLGKMVASLRAGVSVALRPPRLRVRLEVDGEVVEETIGHLAVSNNMFGQGPLPVAARPDEGVLGVYRTEPLSTGAAARTGLHLLRGSWHDAPSIEGMPAQEVVLDVPRPGRNGHATMDGELVPLETRTAIRIHPGELKILMPAAARGPALGSGRRA